MGLNVKTPASLSSQCLPDGGAYVDVGQTRLGVSATLNINRLDYGIRWSQVLDNGSLVVDNNVQIELQFEAIKQGAKK